MAAQPQAHGCLEPTRFSRPEHSRVAGRPSGWSRGTKRSQSVCRVCSDPPNGRKIDAFECRRGLPGWLPVGADPWRRIQRLLGGRSKGRQNDKVFIQVGSGVALFLQVPLLNRAHKTEHTDSTVSCVKISEKLRLHHEIRVQRTLNLDKSHVRSLPHTSRKLMMPV